jgi:hypothetical protein
MRLALWALNPFTLCHSFFCPKTRFPVVLRDPKTFASMSDLCMQEFQGDKPNDIHKRGYGRNAKRTYLKRMKCNACRTTIRAHAINNLSMAKTRMQSYQICLGRCSISYRLSPLQVSETCDAIALETQKSDALHPYRSNICLALPPLPQHNTTRKN